MILVTGATGFVGRSLLQRLAVDHGLQLRVLLRPEADVARLPKDTPLRIMLGAITDGESLLAAMDGVHTVVHLAGTEMRGRHADLVGVDEEGTRKLVEAARIARVGRIIVVSRFGADKASAFPILRSKGNIEDLIKKSGISYTIFRVSTLFGEYDRFSEHIAMLASAFPLYFVPGEGTMTLQPLWVEDLTRCIAVSLESLDLVDRVLDLGGPELLTYDRIVRRVMFASSRVRPILKTPILWHRVAAWFLDGLFARWPFTRQWVDLLSGNRTSELGNVERYFGFRPAQFDLPVLRTYMQKRRYSFEMLRYILTQRW